MHPRKSHLDVLARALALLAAGLLLAGCATFGRGYSPGYFRVQVLDEATQRGIPLVELATANKVLYVTDSAGVAAIEVGALQGQRVFFHVRSHGYEIEPDGLGYRSIRPTVVAGGSHVVWMRRTNVAERLYRVTGAGIYRDSVLLGDRVPLREPLLNSGVFGQDSVLNAIYGGRLYWFWGDTAGVGHPLANMEVSGAYSELPEHGGLDPSVGIDLSYFVDAKGFSREMCPIKGPGAVWLAGLMVLEDEGREKMLAHYSRMKTLGVRLEHGIALWNDGDEIFEKLVEFSPDDPLFPRGFPILAVEEDEPWIYFSNPYPATRVRALLADVVDPRRYQAYTALQPGARWDAEAPALERDANGVLVWGWKVDTAPITPRDWARLLELGVVEADESWMNLHDVETGSRIQAHRGSVSWNAYRNKWVMLALQTHGNSPLGEVWYSEADTLLGPWERARRIVTHDTYSFYNIKQHPYFDQETGRIIYFEGTYTTLFSGNPDPTPRYDYNQIMYRLDLTDPRLAEAQSPAAR